LLCLRYSELGHSVLPQLCLAVVPICNVVVQAQCLSCGWKGTALCANHLPGRTSVLLSAPAQLSYGWKLNLLILNPSTYVHYLCLYLFFFCSPIRCPFSVTTLVSWHDIQEIQYRSLIRSTRLIRSRPLMPSKSRWPAAGAIHPSPATVMGTAEPCAPMIPPSESTPLIRGDAEMAHGGSVRHSGPWSQPFSFG